MTKLQSWQIAGHVEPPDEILPDGIGEDYDHPLMMRPLLPLEAFDHPQLHRHEDHDIPPYMINGHLKTFLAKQCAGLNPDMRIDSQTFREQLVSGEFTPKARYALHWAFGGMRAQFHFPPLISGTHITIYQMVRMFWNVFRGDALGAHAYLNQWADNPDRPLPKLSEFCRKQIIPQGIASAHRKGLISREQAESELERFPWPGNLEWGPFAP